MVSNSISPHLSKIGLSPVVTREVMPPRAPAAKKKNMPASNLGCKSLAAALTAWYCTSSIQIVMNQNDVDNQITVAEVWQKKTSEHLWYSHSPKWKLSVQELYLPHPDWGESANLSRSRIRPSQRVLLPAHRGHSFNRIHMPMNLRFWCLNVMSFHDQ